MTASLLACGIDPSKWILFQQSKVVNHQCILKYIIKNFFFEHWLFNFKVPEHTLLGWVLGTLTTMVRLYHFPQYKEKSSALKDVPLGLFMYPVLQSGDILLYK